jgi:hypothetical protein
MYYVRTVYGSTTHKYESLFQKMMLFKEVFPPVVDILGVISYDFSLLIEVGIKRFKIGKYSGVVGVLSAKNTISAKMSTTNIKFDFLNQGYIHYPVNEILHNPKSYIVFDKGCKFELLFGYSVYDSSVPLYKFKIDVNQSESRRINRATSILENFVGCVVYEGELDESSDILKAGFDIKDYEHLKIGDLLNGYAKKYNLGTYFTGFPMLVFQLV